MTSRTRARPGWLPTSVTDQVAPARAHGPGSSPGGRSTTTLNGSPAGRDCRISPTSSASAPGPGSPIGYRPSQPQRPAHRPPVRPLARHPDRDPGPLDRDRLELPGPVPGQLVQARVEQPGPLARVVDLAERPELTVPGAAEADPEGEAARAQQVQGHRLPGQLVHASARQRRHHRPDPQTAGGGRHRGERHPRVGHGLHRRAVHDVVPEEETVPAPFLGRGRQAGQHPRVGQLVERSHVDCVLHLRECSARKPQVAGYRKQPAV